ncbi:MAG: regulator of sigma E protease [Granulosicoccus sp.]|jgi:regulator of sigma E protease
MDILIQASQFLLSLSFLIVLHEFGHFLPAKLFGMRVEKFYLFFDPWFSAVKKKIGDTEYGIGWVPLGGYVKISGMIDESMDKEQMSKPAEDWEFRSKPAWQRLIVMIGGVTVNVILGVLIYWGVLFTYGETYLPAENAKYGVMVDSLGMELGLQNGDRILALDGALPEKFNSIPVNIVLNDTKVITVERDGQTIDLPMKEEILASLIKSRGFIAPRVPFDVSVVQKGSEAETMGFEKGDKIIGINGEPIRYFDEFKAVVTGTIGESVTVKIDRAGQEMEMTGTVPESGMLGMSNSGLTEEYFDIATKKYGFFESFPLGMKKAYATFDSYVKQMKLIFSPSTKAYESLGGFLTIGSIFSTTWDWHHFWNITAFLSIVLAFMNILPIPALDGGHVMFTLYEMIFQRKPHEKFMEVAQYAGMILLLSLLLFANGNDIIRHFF